MDKKKKRLTEEEFNEVGTAQPVPATSQEVAAATPATTPATTATPAPAEDSVDVVATPQVPAEDSPAIDPLAPPAEGMVPTGWAYPEDLAAAVAMATGDVEAASTAADATVTDQPLVSEEPVEGTEPVSVVPQTTNDLSMEEKRLVMRFRKKKLQETAESMLEAPLDMVSTDNMSMDDFSSDEDTDFAEEEEVVEPPIDMSAILASVDAVFGDQEECEECDEVASDGTEECEECEEEEGGSVEGVSNTLDKLSRVLNQLDSVDSDDVEDMADESTDITKTEVDKAFDFLSALEDNIFDEGAATDDAFEGEEVVADGEVDDEMGDVAENSDEELAFSSAIKEAIKYPAGSTPKASAIASSSGEATSEETPVGDDYEEDLVRSYEQKSRARREAFANFRESLIQRRKEGSKFNEALNSSSEASEEVNKNSKAWINNTFMAKYNESRKLNWKELFDKGLLG